jgi:hypothetical protein
MNSSLTLDRTREGSLSNDPSSSWMITSRLISNLTKLGHNGEKSDLIQGLETRFEN